MSLTERIKQAGNKKNMSLRGIEQKAGLTNGQISRWEQNKPSYDKVLNVANVLNVSVEWLITGQNPGDISSEAQELLNNYYSCNKIGQDRIMVTSEEQVILNPAEPEGVSTSKPGRKDIKTGTDN